MGKSDDEVGSSRPIVSCGSGASSAASWQLCR
ncbi:unnamed protein product, partial [Hydatigera taeniaeformis]|uniref:Uncharacterized protein n=1 Tax=Hydatigena taeniaeformis TaxID=6205 RepID=A0A0R3XDB4_HYDTA